MFNLINSLCIDENGKKYITYLIFSLLIIIFIMLSSLMSIFYNYIVDLNKVKGTINEFKEIENTMCDDGLCEILIIVIYVKKDIIYQVKDIVMKNVMNPVKLVMVLILILV